jgi:hypothetical protein
MWNALARWWSRAQRLETKVDHLLEGIKHMSKELDDLKAAVAAEDTVIDSAVVLIKGLAAQIAQLPADRAAITALAADVQSRGDALSAAVTENTPSTSTARR